MSTGVDVRDGIRSLLHDILPHDFGNAMERQDDFPESVWSALANGGWCGIAIPHEYGGLQLPLGDLAVVVEEIARASVSLGIIFFTSQFSGVRTIQLHGNAQQKASFLPRLARGDIRFAFGFTEPDGGTDFLSNCNTQATKTEAGWRLDGSKIFTTGLQYSDYCLVLAATSERTASAPTSGFTTFIVSTKASGVSWRSLEMMSVRGTRTNQLFLNSVEVPSDSVVGSVDEGFRQLFVSLNEERVLTAALAIGNGLAAVDMTVDYCSQRQAFGGPIGRFQGLQHPIAAAAVQLEAARMLTYKAADLVDSGGDAKVPAAMAKFAASEAGFAAANRAVRSLGGYGMSMELSAQRHLRDSYALINGPLTNEMCLNQIAESLGLARSY
jgi:acyl-CoA dehydrogenase